MKNVHDITPALFAHQINELVAGSPVSPETITMQSGKSKLTVRPAGAFITEWTVDNQEVLRTADPDKLTEAKLPASHFMAPVGPSEGIGGQHGFARWIDYLPNEELTFKPFNILTLEGVTPPGQLQVRRQFHLTPTALFIASTLKNPESGKGAKGSRHTSVGEHLYFAHQSDNPDDLRVEGQTLNKLINDDDAFKNVMGGEAQFWPDFSDDEAEIQLSGGRKLSIKSSLILDPAQPRVVRGGLLFWRGQKAPGSICIEPTFGFRPGQDPARPQNHLLHLPVGSTAIMSTKIELAA